MAFTTSYWERGKLAFIGQWYHKVTKADILAHLKDVDAQWVCATTIHQQGNRRALWETGFRAIAYGGRNGELGSIHLWRIKNPFYDPKRQKYPSGRRGDYDTYSCGVYDDLYGHAKRRNRIYLTRKHLPKAQELCPGWWVCGKKGHSWFYL